MKPELFGIPYKIFLSGDWRPLAFLFHLTPDGIIVQTDSSLHFMKELYSKSSFCEIVIKVEAHIPMKITWEL